jgi:hypothetical protein
MASRRSPEIIAKCAQVTVAPDDNKSTVFNKGTFQGFKIAIPLGGQMAPNSIAGVNDE